MLQENIDLLGRAFEYTARTGEWFSSFEDWAFDVEEVFDAGDRVVAIARQHAKSKHDGPEVEVRVAQVWTFRDDLVARMEMYAERDEALEAAGLSE
jgi:ketosteroid isomerase-like protein